MLNHVTDAKRLEALGLVTRGLVFDLGHVLDERVPIFPGRYFRQTPVTTAHHVNAADGEHRGLGENAVNWITETVTGTMQVGTHLDGLAHLQVGDRAYNGWRVGELARNDGVARLGAETIPQIVTRGWLVEVVGARGVERLAAGDVVTVADVERALGDRRPTTDDAVLFHTGWGAQWDDADAYLAGQPGPGLELAARLVDYGVALTG